MIVGPGTVGAALIYLVAGMVISVVIAQPQESVTGVLPEREEFMRVCGLGADYAIDGWVRSKILVGDFDGDGALDHAAYVRRNSDGGRGVAICRVGTWLDVLGVDGPVPGSAMEDNYFAMVEAWYVSTMADVPGGWIGETLRPQPAGEVLVLGRIEKALYSVYWDGTAFKSHRHHRYVEPSHERLRQQMPRASLRLHCGPAML